jgi:hypothetical protein
MATQTLEGNAIEPALIVPFGVESESATNAA